MILALAACHGPSRPDAPAHTQDTGVVACVSQGSEVPGDGIDGDCDGWTDELGVGEPADMAAAAVFAGEPKDYVGQSLDLGTDRSGRGWLAVGGFSRAAVDGVPVDGVSELEVVGSDPYHQIGETVALADWADGLLVAGEQLRGSLYLFGGGGDQVDTDDNRAELRPVAVSGLQTLPGEPGELAVAGGGALTVLGQPTDGEFPAPRLVVTATYPPTQNFAYQVGESGDLTGDGIPELTAYAEDDAIGGRAYILPSDLTGTVLNTDVGWSLAGSEPYGEAGFAIALGDVDGDGYLDLLTGAALAADRGGVSFVYPGPILGDGLLADGLATFEPQFPSDWCGSTVEALPDQDGDGADEVVIGCPRDPYLGVELPGRVELYAGARVSGTLDGTLADRVFVGRSPFDRFGAALTADGDATGDGLYDLVVGAPYDEVGGEGAGAVYVFAAPLL